MKLTDSSAFFLSVLHSGDSGVSLFGRETVVAFLLSAIPASPAGRHGPLQPCLMSCVAEHLANTCEIQDKIVRVRDLVRLFQTYPELELNRPFRVTIRRNAANFLEL